MSEGDERDRAVERTGGFGGISPLYVQSDVIISTAILELLL